jgi:hypothetical protein
MEEESRKSARSSDLVRQASNSSRSSSARPPDAETNKRRERNRERRRSMSRSRSGEPRNGPSLLGEDATETSDGNCEEELNLSAHRGTSKRSTKLAMVRSDSIRSLHSASSTGSSRSRNQDGRSRAASTTHRQLLSLPNAPDLEDDKDVDPMKEGAVSLPSRLKKYSRSASDGAGKNAAPSTPSRECNRGQKHNDLDNSRHRDRSRTRRWSTAEVSVSSDSNTATSVASVSDQARRSNGYLPSTLGSNRRSPRKADGLEQTRTASLRDVLASSKSPAASLSTASVPDRCHKKKSSDRGASSVSLPGNVHKTSEVRSGSRRIQK